jgi:hypothetical protein
LNHDASPRPTRARRSSPLALLAAACWLSCASRVASAAPTFDFANFATADPAVQLAGNAALSGTNVRLTDSQTNRRSAVWVATPQDVTQSFTARLTFTITKPDTARANAPNGADGLALVLQNDPRTPLSAVLGSDGGQLGYGYLSTGQAIRRSLAVAFRTFIYQQVQVFTNGDDPANALFDSANGTLPIASQIGNLDNVVGVPQTLSLAYDVVERTLTVRLNDRSIGLDGVALPAPLATIVGGNTAFFGVTGATGGGGYSTIDVSRFSDVVAPEPNGIGVAIGALALLASSRGRGRQRRRRR